jgi:hypothetical protein
VGDLVDDLGRIDVGEGVMARQWDRSQAGG